MIGSRLAHVAANELRSMLRDYTFLIVALVGPIIFATITSLAFASFDHPKPVRLVVTTGSAGSARNSLVRAIQRNTVLHQAASVRVVPSVAQARSLIRDGGADAGLVLPARASLTAGVLQLHGTAVELQTQQQPFAAEVAQVVLQTIGGGEWVHHVVLSSLTGITPDPSGILHRFVLKNPVQLAEGPASSRSLTAATYYGSSMAIVFLLFVVTPWAKSLWTERQNNTLDRLLASGVGRGTIVAGKALAAQLTGMLSVATVWAASTVIFHADWGDPAAVAVLATVTATATVALSFGLATLTRSEASFDGVVAVVAFILVLAGGNFVPPAALPGGLRRLTLVTPNGWALRGFLDLATSSAGVSAIIMPLLAIMTFTVTIWVAVGFRLGRLISP